MTLRLHDDSNFYDGDTPLRFDSEADRDAFAVSHLLDDDALSADEEAQLRRAVADDASLAAVLGDFEKLDALLKREPDWSRVDLPAITENVMASVARDEAEKAGQTDPTPLRIVPDAPAADTDTEAPAARGLLGRRSQWFVGVAAVAAAIVLGLTILPTLLAPQGGDSVVPRLNIEGPVATSDSSDVLPEIQVASNVPNSQGSVQIGVSDTAANAAVKGESDIDGPGSIDTDAVVGVLDQGQSKSAVVTKAATDETAGED